MLVMPPVSERVARGAVIGFALWTVAAHVVVAVGGNLYLLLGVAPLVLAAGAAANRWLPLPPPPTLATSTTVAITAPWVRAIAGALAALTVGLFVLTGNGTMFWWGIVACLLFAVGVTLRETPPAHDVAPRGAVAGKLQERGLWVLSVASAAFALVLHRPENDDGLYVAVAARAVDDPTAPLLTNNPVLGIPDLPLNLPAYKVHGLELLAAAISWTTQLPAIAVFHLLIGPAVAALVPLAYAALYRRLLPGSELRATAMTLCILVLFPRTPHGADAFAHPWIGATLFLAVLMPLLGAAAWDLARAPGLRRFASLALLQIAAIGATSSALWAAPVTVTYFGLTALARPAPARRRLRAAALGLASCAYPVVAGLTIRAAFAARGTMPGTNSTAAPPEIGRATVVALGSPAVIAVIWMAVLCAWSWQRHRPARDFALFLPALFALTLYNPYLSSIVASYATSSYVFDRVLWVLPAAVFLALLAHALWEAARGWRGPARVGLAAVAAVALGSASLWGGFERHGWNNLSILRFPPGLKVPHPGYDVAARLHELVGPGRTVLAVQWVSLWLPTFHDPPFPLASRRQYLDSLGQRGRRQEAVQRVLLSAFVGGEIDRRRPFAEPIPDLVAYLERGLGELQPDAVCLSPSMVGRQDVLAVLQRTGYEYRENVAGFAIWLRPTVDEVVPDPDPR